MRGRFCGGFVVALTFCGVYTISAELDGADHSASAFFCIG